jgi:clan AA aspartic protease (TIGR02281 family)
MRYNPIGLAVFIVLLLQSAASPRAAEIPLGSSGGIYTVAGLINRSVAVEFLVDPGAGTVVIPASALQQLVQNGSVNEGDVIGIGAAELPDSSLYLTARVRLRELQVGNTAVRDVTAAVSPALKHPLLGQSFLRRFGLVTFDNRRQVLILSDDAAAPVAQAPATTWVAPHPSYPYHAGGYPAPAYNQGYGGGYPAASYYQGYGYQGYGR